MSRYIVAFLGSPRFFYGVVIFLVLQALWFAFTAVYPMAFDEQFHFGLIQIYAEQWSPLLLEAPPGSGEFGALTRDPSYLYHYLMSFPHRFFSFFVANETAQILFLRLINIGFFAAGLVAFQRLLRMVNASPALTHFILLMLVLIPISPMLAAHINYDNVIFLLIPIIAILTLRLRDSIKQHSVSSPMLLALIALCMFASLVKYAFLPVCAATFLYLLFVFWRLPRREKRATFASMWTNFTALSTPLKIGLVAAVIVVGGLFAERYGGNLVQYQMVVPHCDRVMDFEHCSQYSVWLRNYEIRQNTPEYVDPNPLYYAVNWYYDMSYRLFFAINADYLTRPPLPLPFITALLIGVGGVITSLVFLPRLLRRQPALWLFVGMVGLYGAILFVRGYMGYLGNGQFLALNGRYFIPLMPLIMVLVGLSIRELLAKSAHALVWKASLVIVTVLLFLQGGGVLTYLVRSDPTWHWPHPVVIELSHYVNETAETFISLKDFTVPPSN